MPAALERKLKKEANKKGIKDKDAYVYGTLRKTGWKPSREKKMEAANPRLVRLARIDKELDAIIQFQDDDDQHPWKTAGGEAAGIGAGATTVGGGLYAAGALSSKAAGGAGLGVRQAIAKTGQAVSKIGQGGGKTIGKTIGKGANVAGSAAKSIWDRLKGLGKGALETATHVAESKEKPIEFGAAEEAGGDVMSVFKRIQAAAKAGPAAKAAESAPSKPLDYFEKKKKQLADRIAQRKAGYTLPPSQLSSEDRLIQFGKEILGPWQGGQNTGKLYQGQFPAGLSPAAVLKFPFPKLMAYLNQRNLQQQVFSWKQGRLIQLSAKLDEITFETEADRFNRAYDRWKNSDQFKGNVQQITHKIRKGAAIVGGTGAIAGTGLAGYGLYRRGKDIVKGGGKTWNSWEYSGWYTINRGPDHEVSENMTMIEING